MYTDLFYALLNPKNARGHPILSALCLLLLSVEHLSSLIQMMSRPRLYCNEFVKHENNPVIKKSIDPVDTSGKKHILRGTFRMENSRYDIKTKLGGA